MSDLPWQTQEIQTLRTDLLTWYDHHKRDLPWRRTSDPYAIWVSEIMLQQTQVATVIDYFNRWMVRFPTLEDLANAELDDVLSMWAGLGYYRRARLLHRASKQVMEDHQGCMPTTAKTLIKLSGIGKYTAGAVASIAYGEVAPIVDGNVERILARLCAIAGDPKQKENQKQFWSLAECIVDPERPGDLNQAMMELGATVCTPKKPTCLLCPVRDMCKAHDLGNVTQFPAKVKRAKKKDQAVISCIIVANSPEDESVHYVSQRPAHGLLAGMWEFLTIDAQPNQSNTQTLSTALDAHFGDQDRTLQQVGQCVHVFTHINMTFDIYEVHLNAQPVVEQELPFKWCLAKDIPDVTLSTAQRKVWQKYQDAKIK